MIFRQVIHDDLGCASYLIGDEDAGSAAVVDPRLDIDEYLRLAGYLGVAVDHILETHNHADHVSGHGRLRAATGAPIHIHELASPEYEHDPIRDGWELELGRLRVRALHTPGHRPEHTAFVLTDTGRGERPWAVLSGDSLFVGDVARPDLAIERSEGAREVHASLHDRLLRLPDECELWPGHLGGSLCGGPGMDMKVSSTIGFERENQELLAIEGAEDFVAASIATLGPQPPDFERIVAINRGPLTDLESTAPPLSPHQVEELGRRGALLVDLRTEVEFDQAHVPGAVSVTGLRAGFGTKLAWLAPQGTSTVLIGSDGEDALRAVPLAAAVGRLELGGYLVRGMTAWRQEGREVASTERMSVERLLELDPGGTGGIQVLDVRERAEWDAGHIPGSTHRPYHAIDAVPDELDAEAEIAVVCSSGQRSAVAASLLQRHGARRVVHVVGGGVPLWARLGGPIENPSR